MITRFDKTSAIALYKREFAECIKTQRFEDALDVLLKFTEATENPDFHLACGMLYLLMAQDSDDRELLSMAYREFMMQLRVAPDCEAAYRNLLASAIMRREPTPLIECSEWLKARGQDIDIMLDELAEVGIGVFSDDSDMMYLEALFDAGEFGVIGEGLSKKVQQSGGGSAKKDTEKKSKVIPFRASVQSETDEVRHGKPKVDKDRLNEQRKNNAFEFDLDDEADDEIEYDDFGIDEILSGNGLRSDNAEWDKDLPIGLRSRVALRSAEEFCEKGDFDKALAALNRIDPHDKQMHYCAQCVRAFIFLQRGDIEMASDAIDSALSVKRSGALAGTLLCALFEMEGECDRIPQTLKNIDVTDFVDADHVYKAMRFAIKYCKAEDTIKLARDYIEEFNVMDIRQLYAQVLYNSGNRAEATDELYILSRIFYDDFNAQYYYLMAKAGAESMPVDEEAPQASLGLIVNTVTGMVQTNAIDEEMIESDAFKFGLEVYLTLEYQNDRKTMVTMFDTLRKLAANVMLDGKMRDALCSPYVEPIVKAVILSQLLTRSDEFLMSLSYCPISDDSVPTLGEGYALGCYIAYAFVLVFCKRKIKRFIELANELNPILTSESFFDGKELNMQTAIDKERDIANYLIRAIKRESKGIFPHDDRIDYALGYTTKAAANAAFKAVSQKLKTK